MKATLTCNHIGGEKIAVDGRDFETLEFTEQKSIVLNLIKNIKDSPQAIGIMANILQLCADVMEIKPDGSEVWECEFTTDKERVIEEYKAKLRELGVWEEFVFNYNDSYGDYVDLQEYLKECAKNDYTIEDVLVCAFTWTGAKEGAKFWIKIANELI